MATNEEANSDPRLDALLRASGQVWPMSDEELDTWLARQELSDDEEAWLRDVVRRRVAEAAGFSESVGTPVEEPASAAAKFEADLAGESAKSAADPAGAAAVAPPRARRLSSEDLALLNEQLLDLVESGVSLPAGLASYASDLKAGRLEAVLAQLRSDLAEGQTLSEAMARQGDALPPLYKALVAAGEAGGDLTTCLALLHEQAEVNSDLDRRVRESLAYPAVTFFGAVVGIVAMLGWLLPQFQSIFDNMGVSLPGFTKVLLAVSGFVNQHPILMTIALVGLLVLGLKVVPTYAPELVRKAAGLGGGIGRAVGELSRALGGFIGRGLPLPAAIEALRGADLGLPAGTLDRVQERLQGGATLADALRPEDAFPPTYVWLVGAAEARGDLAEVLGALARRSERSYRTRLRFVEAVVGPVAMMGIGLLVGASVLGVFLPIFEMQRALQQ